MTLTSLIISLVLAFIAYRIASNWNNVLFRILGMGYLIVRGGLWVYSGLIGGVLMPLVVGVLMLILASVAWQRRGGSRRATAEESWG